MSGILYWRLRWALGRCPLILCLFRCIPQVRRTVVTRKTDLLIEGFPRSGNSFARNAFLLACNHEYKLSSHLHFIANVRRAIRLKKPVLILVRNPLDAVSSYLIYRGDRFPVAQALYEYIDFYTYVLENREHLAVASFEEVTKSFGKVLERVNQRFQTSFPLFNHTPDNVERCLDTTRDQISPWFSDRRRWNDERNVSAPDTARVDLKEAIQSKLHGAGCRDMLRQAQKIHDALTVQST